MSKYLNYNNNYIFEGDNFSILKNINPYYASRINCIYIDPPYNTGEKFKYYQDDKTHADWLNDMRSVLLLLWPLLADDGSLWISINDKEVHYLKVLCDELFGRDKYLSTIIWQQRTSRENRTVFSCNHEYILVYAKNPLKFKLKRKLTPAPASYYTRYKNPDNDPRGPWQSISANVQAGHAVASQFYTIIGPTGKIFTPPAGRCWVYNKKRMKEEIKAGNIWFGEKGDGVPRIKRFLDKNIIGLVPETLWLSDYAGTNNDAKKHLKQLNIYDKELFDTPKPELLIYRILSIATDPNDIVLDAFLGSGTTAAVAHKMGRRYIGIENNHNTVEKVKLRLDAVINGHDNNNISKIMNWRGGGDDCIYL